jgi:hypothetical protein
MGSAVSTSLDWGTVEKKERGQVFIIDIYGREG